MAFTFVWIVVLLLLITSTGLILVRDWRWSIILLAVQYLGMFLLTLQHWPLGMASVKLVAGWMSAAILGMTRSSFPSQEIDEQGFWPRGRLFRLFAVGMVLLIVSAMIQPVDTIMADAGYAVTAGSLILIGMGLLHLGITSYILRVVIGLMTVLSGFEILYAAVEGSILVAALLATINLGLALVGAYLLIAQNNAEQVKKAGVEMDIE
jgi:hypothetical protein